MEGARVVHPQDLEAWQIVKNPGRQYFQCRVMQQEFAEEVDSTVLRAVQKLAELPEDLGTTQRYQIFAPKNGGGFGRHSASHANCTNLQRPSSRV